MNRGRIVVLGMMTRMPVAGVVWQTVHYLLGFGRLGYEPWYVEAHGMSPSSFSTGPHDPGTNAAAHFLSRTLDRFGLGGRWAFHALHDDGRCLGLDWDELRRLYASADLIVNLHGGTTPRAEHAWTGRLVYLGTDPVQVEVELDEGRPETIAFLEPHCAFFTFGENIGGPDCLVPVSRRFAFRPTRQPVVLDLWDRGDLRGAAPVGPPGDPPGRAYTTVGNWRQQWRTVELRGEQYGWSKHTEFMKVVALPRRVRLPLEVALAGYRPSDELRLARRGWRVRPASEISADPDAYRDYIASSRGEFTVAKDQNVRLRSGWFSDRSATYLACGRPVVTQETGFSNHLPVGEGLFAFTTIDEAAAALEAIESGYERHAKAAAALAREHFDSDVVLSRLLDEVGPR